jgi:uncharacterized protein YjiS (DUF1127 family)
MRKMIMNKKLSTQANAVDRRLAWNGVLVSTAKTWWMAYLMRRMEREAIIQLRAMSDRQLEDIGITRSQIE